MIKNKKQRLNEDTSNPRHPHPLSHTSYSKHLPHCAGKINSDKCNTTREKSLSTEAGGGKRRSLHGNKVCQCVKRRICSISPVYFFRSAYSNLYIMTRVRYYQTWIYFVRSLFVYTYYSALLFSYTVICVRWPNFKTFNCPGFVQRLTYDRSQSVYPTIAFTHVTYV